MNGVGHYNGKTLVEHSMEFDHYYDSGKVSDKEFEDTRKLFETVIGNFNKRNSGGSGICAYSGIFNPRSIARNDYRYFDRSISTNGNNRFGTFHLNLMIDESGSFYESTYIVNRILKILTDLEAKYPNFSMDVYFVGMGIRKANSIRERELSCDGGNSLDESVKETVKKAQKNGTYNYNIILFDGDAFSDCSRMDLNTKQKIFRGFDIANTTLITDPDNDEYIGNRFSSATVIETTDYTKELLTHIKKALANAFH